MRICIETIVKVEPIFSAGWTPVMYAVFLDKWDTVDTMLSVNLSRSKDSKKLFEVINTLRHETLVLLHLEQFIGCHDIAFKIPRLFHYNPFRKVLCTRIKAFYVN